MTNEGSKRDRNRKIGLVLMGVGFVLWLIFGPIIPPLTMYLLRDIGFLMLVGGVIIVLINLKKTRR